MGKKAQEKLWTRFGDLSTNDTDGDAKASAEYLASLGLDPKEEASFGLTEITRLHFMAKAYAAQARDNSLLAKLKSKIAGAIARNEQLAGNVLQQAMRLRKASFQFRNIEKWSDEEMREVLNDLDISKLMEDLDKID